MIPRVPVTPRVCPPDRPVSPALTGRFFFFFFFWKQGNFSINKRSRGTGRAPRGFHNLTLFQSTRNTRGRAGARGGVGHPLTLARVRGARCRPGALVGGGLPPGVTSHMLGAGRLTLMSRRKGSLYHWATWVAQGTVRKNYFMPWNLHLNLWRKRNK